MTTLIKLASKYSLMLQPSVAAHVRRRQLLNKGQQHSLF